MKHFYKPVKRKKDSEKSELEHSYEINEDSDIPIIEKRIKEKKFREIK